MIFFVCKSRLRARLCGFFIVFLLSVGGQATRCDPLPSVVLLLLPGLQANDLTRPELSSIARLTAEGGSGWMVCRAARVSDTRLLRSDGRESNASLLVTLGSGARAVAPLPTAVSPASRLLALQSANASLDHKVPLGALGDLFHRRGLQTATLGDDDSTWPDNAAWYVAMDSAGKVDIPMRHSGAVADAASPFGVRTDVATLLADFDVVRSRAGLIVLECSALDRADRYAPFCRPAVAAQHRLAAYRTLDSLIVGVLSRCRAHQVQPSVPILLLAPAPSASSEERTDRLAPIVWWGSGDTAGALFTASTRRPGLVLNTDVLATLAERLNLPLPSGATGRPFYSDHATGAPPALNLPYNEWMRVARLQNSPGGLPTLQLLLPLIGTMLLVTSTRVQPATRKRLYRSIGVIACLVLAVPLGMLLLPLFRPANSLTADALLATTLLMIGLFAACRPSALPALFRILCGLLLLALLIDLPTGTHLLQSAWMSYSVVEGARFYGIGNEYMGVAIGAACVLFSLSGTPARPISSRADTAQILGFMILFLVLTLGMGVYGAKVGAIPSAGTAFGITLLVWKRGRLGVREIVLILLLAAAGLGMLAFFDSRHAAGDQTHFIRALTGAGGGSLPEILLRKLQMEGWLLLHSAWSATLVVTASALAWIRRASPQIFASRRPQATLPGLGIGALACLLCNDSGLTAAALLLLYGWAWAALKAIQDDAEIPSPH